MPISISTIEKKLKRDEYPTVTTIESDLKRMTMNAKSYNDPGSVIYEDAERIRKLVFNFMKVNNPAYKEDPKYTSFGTPLPDEPSRSAQNGAEESAADESQPENEKSARGTTVAGSEPPDRKTSVAPSATTGGEPDAEGQVDLDLTGKSFQEAQQMIISHLLHYSDSE